MQSGRKGMGSHKHGVSGRNGPSPKQKQNLAREANREIQAKQDRQKKKRAANPLFDWVGQLMDSARRR